MSLTLVTWNLKGSAGPDIDGVVDHLRAQGADIVGLQEVQWHQARRIARALGARSRRWGFKHWPVRTWPEGMAVIGVTRTVHVRTLALSHRWWLWSWRRRIMQLARVDSNEGHVAHESDDARPPAGGSAGDGGPFTLVNVHLTPHGEIQLRVAETVTVLAAVAQRSGPIVVSGDLNERPGGAIHRQLTSAGLRDAWAEPGENGAPPESTTPPPDRWPTNWRGWRRGTSEPPTQRLDYVYVSAEVEAVDVSVPHAGDDGFARFANLSDHLPVTAALDVGSPGNGQA